MESSLIDVNIYCDESRYSNNEDPYLVIGAVKCLRDKKPEIANALIKMKRAYGIGGEFGWKTASRNKKDFYRRLPGLVRLLAFRLAFAHTPSLTCSAAF